MHIIWLLLLILSLSKINASNMKARLAEWDDEYRNGDDVRRLLKLFSRGKNITEVEEDFLNKDKRQLELDKTDTRQGIRIEAAPYIQKYGHGSLGDCTAGNHKYKGKEDHTPFYRVNYKYTHQSGRFRSNQFTDIMGGVSISAFGLFGGSVKARVTSSVRRDTRSLLIYSHFVIHKGVISLVNPQIGTNWQDCTKQPKHYYLRDILTGLDDYLLVKLRFSSEAKRKEIEVKIKIKLLFFSISKTIRRIKTSLKTNFELDIFRIKTFPHPSEDKIDSSHNLEAGIRLVEKYENSRSQLLRDINGAKNSDPNLHLEYFFVPCLIKTITEALPFTRANSFILAELIERTTELKSVLEDIESIKSGLDNNRKSKLEKFEEDVKSRLNRIKEWKEKSKLSHNYVKELLEEYGEKRAPYYYQRQFRKIVGDLKLP